MGTWQYAEGREKKAKKADADRRRTGGLCVGVERDGRCTADSTPGCPFLVSVLCFAFCADSHAQAPGSAPVSVGLFRFFFPPFRVLPCAHTERSANFGHVPIPAGSLGWKGKHFSTVYLPHVESYALHKVQASTQRNWIFKSDNRQTICYHNSLNTCAIIDTTYKLIQDSVHIPNGSHRS